VQGILQSPEGRDSSSQNSNKHGGARPTLKILFPPSLVSCLHYQVFLPHASFKQFQQNYIISFKNCDVDSVINPAGYQSKKNNGRKLSHHWASLAFR